MNFAFQNPWAFVLLLLVPVVVWRSFGGRAAIRYPAAGVLVSHSATWRTRLLWLPPALRAAALLCLIVAAARPQVGLDPVKNLTEGVAINMVVDRSGSMTNRIVFRGERQTKLAVVKTVFTEFLLGDEKELGGRPSDLVGVIAFAGTADTISPLTHSHDALVKLLEELDMSSGTAASGTAIGDAVALGAARLETAEKELGDQEDGFRLRSKVMILLTDGEHNAGERSPAEGVALARRWGIKIYTIGFGGSDEGAAMLEGAAASTGGLYQRAEDANSLRAVYEEIDRLEKTDIEAIQYLTEREYFVPLALAALILLLIELLLARTVLRRLP